MSWTRYLLHDFFTAHELNRIDERFRRSRTASASTRAGMYDRIDELEDDLGRATLIVHALAEACVRKGLLTREEIAAMVNEVDLRDGKSDGKLDSTALRPPRAEHARRPMSPEQHLHELEKQDESSPGDFLADLERDADDAAS